MAAIASRRPPPCPGGRTAPPRRSVRIVPRPPSRRGGAAPPPRLLRRCVVLRRSSPSGGLDWLQAAPAPSWPRGAQVSSSHRAIIRARPAGTASARNAQVQPRCNASRPRPSPRGRRPPPAPPRRCRARSGCGPSPGQVGHHRHRDADDARGDAVEHLGEDQPVRVGQEGREERAGRQHAQATRRSWRRPRRSAREPAKSATGIITALRDDDVAGGPAGAVLTRRDELLADEAQHRAVGEVEQGERRREDQEPAVRQDLQDAGALRLVVRVVLLPADGAAAVIGLLRRRQGRHDGAGGEPAEDPEGDARAHVRRAEADRQRRPRMPTWFQAWLRPAAWGRPACRPCRASAPSPPAPPGCRRPRR